MKKLQQFRSRFGFQGILIFIEARAIFLVGWLDSGDSVDVVAVDVVDALARPRKIVECLECGSFPVFR